MATFLYLAEDTAVLGRRWASEQAAPPAQVLFEGRDGAALAGVVLPAVPAVALDAFGGAGGDDVVVLPFAPDVRPLRYAYPVQVPLWQPYYPLVRRLWAKGFRHFRWYSPAGTRDWQVPHLLDEFAGRHTGQRCFVVGNGPSLNNIDMKRLANEITFGANRGYLGSPEWGFTFPYWGVYDPLQIEEYGQEYEASVPEDTVKFYPLEYAPFLSLARGCPVPIDWPRTGDREFSTDPGRLVSGYSVTYMLLQVAALMGCDPIYVVGLDHRYGLRKGPGLTRLVRLGARAVARRYDGTAAYQAVQAAAWAWFKARRGGGPSPARIWDAGDAGAPTHFHQGYTAGQKRFLMPRPQDAARDYACAAAWARAQQRQILNATPDTALDTLPKVDFERLFEGADT